MSDWLPSVLGDVFAQDGFGTLVFAAALAGLVRGFSGFGKSMIYMPFAGTVLPPVWAVTSVLVFDMIGPLPNVPRALRDGTPADVLRLAAGAVIALPLGLYLLVRLDPVFFRWLVSMVALVLLVLLVSGWRYRGRLSNPMLMGVGLVSGFVGGASGVPGPPVIMLYMSSPLRVAAIRGNILVYLIFFDVLTLGVLALHGRLELVPMLIGLVLVVPFMIANIAGAALFRPEREGLYRVVAYILIGYSALSNLPLFG